jgi:hypothetical protein
MVLAGACATSSKQASESPNPTTKQVATSQQASEEALKRAQEAQKRASDQANKAAEAQARVRQDEEKLRQDQETARTEQAKAQQLQVSAQEETQQATRQTEQQQGRAAAGLSAQTETMSRGHQLAVGVVTQVRPDEVTVQPASGEPMKFWINDATKVQVEGRQASSDDIKEGQQARVAYQASSNGPTAVSIQVRPLGSRSSGMGTGSSGTGSSSGTEGSSPQGPGSQGSQTPSNSGSQ